LPFPNRRKLAAGAAEAAADVPVAAEEVVAQGAAPVSERQMGSALTRMASRRKRGTKEEERDTRAVVFMETRNWAVFCKAEALASNWNTADKVRQTEEGR